MWVMRVGDGMICPSWQGETIQRAVLSTCTSIVRRSGVLEIELDQQYFEQKMLQKWNRSGRTPEDQILLRPLLSFQCGSQRFATNFFSSVSASLSSLGDACTILVLHTSGWRILVDQILRTPITILSTRICSNIR